MYLGRVTTLTSKGQADMIVNHYDLSNRSGVLKLKHGFLLYSEYDYILSAYANL